MHKVTDGVSVADPGSRISDLESWIPDPTTAKKEDGEDICCPTFFVARNITKLKIILFLNWEEKSLSQFTKNYSTFYSKIVTKLSKILGSRGQNSKRHRIPDLGSGSATLDGE